jgi:hypothetical protein
MFLEAVLLMEINLLEDHGVSLNDGVLFGSSALEISIQFLPAGS